MQAKRIQELEEQIGIKEALFQVNERALASQVAHNKTQQEQIGWKTELIQGLEAENRRLIQALNNNGTFASIFVELKIKNQQLEAEMATLRQDKSSLQCVNVDLMGKRDALEAEVARLKAYNLRLQEMANIPIGGIGGNDPCL